MQRKGGAKFIIRGLRALSDFEHEFQMYLINKKLNSEIEMLYFMNRQEYFHLSSSIVKEIAKLRSNISNFVPQIVERKLLGKFS